MYKDLLDRSILFNNQLPHYASMLSKNPFHNHNFKVKFEYKVMYFMDRIIKNSPNYTFPFNMLYN